MSDYNASSPLEGLLDGKKVLYQSRGVTRSKGWASAGQMEYKNVDNFSQFSYSISYGGRQGQQLPPFEIPGPPSTYTCQGDSLVTKFASEEIRSRRPLP